MLMWFTLGRKIRLNVKCLTYLKTMQTLEMFSTRPPMMECVVCKVGPCFYEVESTLKRTKIILRKKRDFRWTWFFFRFAIDVYTVILSQFNSTLLEEWKSVLRELLDGNQKNSPNFTFTFYNALRTFKSHQYKFSIPRKKTTLQLGNMCVRLSTESGSTDSFRLRFVPGG
jgi:hypothetical protein